MLLSMSFVSARNRSLETIVKIYGDESTAPLFKIECASLTPSLKIALVQVRTHENPKYRKVLAASIDQELSDPEVTCPERRNRRYFAENS